MVAPGARLAFETTAGLSAEAALNGGPVLPVPATGLRAPDEGDHWLVTISRSTAGVPSAPRWVWLRVDSVAPSVALSVTPTPWESPDGQRWVPPGAEVEAQALDELAGVAKVSLRAGDAARTATEDGVSLPLPIEGGAMQVTADAVDRVGNASTTTTLSLMVDAWPPTGTVRVEGSWVEGAGGPVLGPHARLLLEDDDRGAGIADRAFAVDGARATQQVWGAPWSAGRHEAGVTLRDHVGNLTNMAPFRFEVDAEGPEVEWQVTSAGATSSAGLMYYRTPVTVEASASDAVAGLASLARVGAAEDVPIGEPMVIDGSSLELLATDRVGNETRLEASWQTDDEAPRIQVLGPRGRPLPPDTARKRRVRVGARLTLSVVDEGVGLDEATYVLNRLTIPGFAPPAPVPAHLDLTVKGQYRLTIEARDRLGHASRAQWLLNVGLGGN